MKLLEVIEELKKHSQVAFQVQPDLKAVIYATPLWNVMDSIRQAMIIEMEARFQEAGLIINDTSFGYKQINF